MELAHVTCRFCGAVLLAVSLEPGGIRSSRFFGTVVHRDLSEDDRAEAQCERCDGRSGFRRSLLGAVSEPSRSTGEPAPREAQMSTGDSSPLSLHAA